MVFTELWRPGDSGLSWYLQVFSEMKKPLVPEGYKGKMGNEHLDDFFCPTGPQRHIWAAPQHTENGAETIGAGRR